MPVDTSYYEAARRATEGDYATKSSANTFNRNATQSTFNRNYGDVARDFGRAAPKFTAGYGRRGLTGAGVGSGVYRQAFTNYLGDYQRNQGNMQQDWFNQDQQYGSNQALYDSARQGALADLELQKQSQIANAAQEIQGLRPLFS